MAKAKIYGLKNKCNPRLQLDLRYQRKLKQRQRESVTRKPVAGQITNGNPAKMVNPPELPTKYRYG